MGMTANKIAGKIASQLKLNVVALSGQRAARQICEEVPLDSDWQKSLISKGHDPCHAAYIHAQNIASVLAERVSEIKEPVYDIHRRAELLLAENGRLSPYFRRRNEHWLHQLMAACVSASMQLAITQRGHRYLSKPDILTRSRCPESTRQAQKPLALPLSASSEGKYVVPDDLFGIEYAGVKPTYRFMAVEIDRKTESIERTELKQNAFGKKIQAYLDVMRNRTYNEHWGIRNLRMLTVTTNITHLHNLRAFVQKHVGPEFAERFLFKAKPGFGSNWNIPDAMHDLFLEP
jgi:hypothetical protein